MKKFLGILEALLLAHLLDYVASARLVVNDRSLLRRFKHERAIECWACHWDKKLAQEESLQYEEDVSWMATNLQPWLQFLVYSTKQDTDAIHKTQSQTGREAQAYLQFVVDYYNCLPQTTVFIHAHRSSPHSLDIMSDLRRLRWEAIPGYALLQSNRSLYKPCVQRFLSMSRPQGFNTFYFAAPEKHRPNPNNTSETARWMQFAFEQSILIKGVWPKLFQEELGAIPKELTAPRSGQFAVTRKQIMAHPKSFYQGILSWLQTTDVDSFWAGLIFEQLWSYIFGAGTEYKHPAECTVFICNDGIPSLPPFQSSTQQMAILNSLMSRESSKTKVW